MRTKNSILISGYYGFDNSGDDAILKSMVKDMQKLNSELDIKVLSNNPRKTEEIYSVQGINRFEYKEVIKAIKNTDLFISGGGSLLQDITSTRSLLYYLTLLKIAKIFKRKTMVYANGIGPIDKKFNRYLTRKVLNKVDLISLRDKNSLEFIESLGVKNKNVYVTADPVFTLEPAPKSRIEEIFKKENIPNDKKFIGISVRNWDKAENLISVISESIIYMIDRYDVNIILISMHYPEDLDIGEKIKEKVNRESCYLIKGKYTVEEIMGIIKELEVILAMRLHSLIYAATQEVPMIGLSYDPKVDGILHSLEMDYICNVENLNLSDLRYMVDIVWNNRLDLKERLKKQDEDLRKKALSNVEMALELLNSR